MALFRIVDQIKGGAIIRAQNPIRKESAKNEKTQLLSVLRCNI